jgi:ribosome-associated protein
MEANIRIGTGFIRLGALLKYAGVAGSGADAKAMIQDGKVRVNGATETRRGRKIVPGDRVEAAGRTLAVE